MNIDVDIKVLAIPNSDKLSVILKHFPTGVCVKYDEAMGHILDLPTICSVQNSIEQAMAILKIEIAKHQSTPIT